MTRYHFASFVFDPTSGALSQCPPSGEPETVYLRHKVSQLLAYLLAHAGEVIGKDALLDALWQHGEYRENSLTQSIRELRKALGDSAQSPRFIKTHPQRGYQWICPVSEPPVPTEAETTSSAAPFASTPAGSPPADSAPPNTTALDKVRRRTRASWTVAASVLICLVIAVAAWRLYPAAQPESAEQASALLVLPLSNETGDPQLDWMALGLADMLGVSLGQQGRQPITPPAMANLWLLDNELSWPALPGQIRTLLQQKHHRVALSGSVRLHNGQQVLDFQLIYADGTIQQGSIAYPSLATATQAISRQLQLMLNPQRAPASPPVDESTMQVQTLAQGRHLLQTAGAYKARKYFEAALVLQPEDDWARIQLAQVDLLLGDWDRARAQLSALSDTRLQHDHALRAAHAYWLSELSYRSGEANAASLTEEAIAAAELADNPMLKARAYQLSAQQAWNRMDWERHQQDTVRSIALLGDSHALRQDADKQFYLGNPANEGLEKSPTVDLRANQPRLRKALNFYRQLHDQPKLAATQLAIAQNYTFPLDQREAALSDAIARYRQLQQPYELAQALLYQGFYLMQLHQGKEADRYFKEASQIATGLGARTLLQDSQFYRAFAAMDQGLDQRERGGHGPVPVQLKRASDAFHTLLAQNPPPQMQANIHLFLGWILTQQAAYEAANATLQHAERLASQQNMATTLAYIRYSRMRVALAQQDYDAVIAMAQYPVITRLQAVYLARAYFETGQAATAVQVLDQFRRQRPEQWQPDDQRRRVHYQRAGQGQPVTLAAEPNAHLVYCETDWLTSSSPL
ncbi:winged helix-turn-helix domain-containing protein [Photobacterium sp. TY1-4]|uniref:winged helix-turn-helix domain-containing protein n=1 Tax=Photobacterium sp. TY1-4 TaxID=2899122 RepID=UPI0021C0F65F|nr:winged helix-turn-helix domain-containing protein [Photobacterium sp. TY1-4]UXI00983.1 winged helix-turn-helix domain-containing protein [Photobacterium sp. TY1-4]